MDVVDDSNPEPTSHEGKGSDVRVTPLHELHTTVSAEKCLVPSSIPSGIKGSCSHWNVKNAAVAKTMESERF